MAAYAVAAAAVAAAATAAAVGVAAVAAADVVVSHHIIKQHTHPHMQLTKQPTDRCYIAHLVIHVTYTYIYEGGALSPIYA